MKKNQQRVLSSVLAAGMLTSMVPAALASDITGHWAQDIMQKFIDSNYLSGYGNDIYGPNQAMSRAEFAALINRVAGLTKESASISQYTDVPADAWYRSDMAKALAAGYLSGMTSTTMAPNAAITREQAICMVARILGLESGDTAKLERFTDRASIADWAKSDIAAMVEAGYVSGNTDGTLLPKKELTRAEGVTILNQALDQLKKVSGDSTTPAAPGTSTGSSSSSGGGSSSSGGGSSSSSSKVYTASSWETLKSAAFHAKAGDTIRLSADITDAGSDTAVVDGVSSATLTLNKKNITLDGNGKTISAAEGKTFCFDLDGLAGETTGVTVKNLTIDGGSFSSKLGGAMFIEDGAQALIQNVTFRNCRAASTSAFNGGGAIFINDHGQIPPAVTVDGCTFENNQVGSDGTTGRGGAIYADNFRASSAMQLTVKNSTFRNNQAAYGGAIAADGVVDLTVTDCTFEDNAAAVGADDIYIFEGVSAGKKNMSITSKVTAFLSGNAHTNETDSETDMTAMNIIFGRYYDAASTEKNAAPEGAADLYFADVERTELLDPEAAVAMQTVDVNGITYYYGINRAMADEPVFTVNGDAAAAENIDGTNVYYCTAAEQWTGDLYGTATLTYKEFYEGEVGTTDSYDAVSSATTAKNTIFRNEDSTEPAEGEGYKINGVKNVPVRVAADQYVKGTIAGAAGVTSIAGYSKAAGVTLNETPSAEVNLYKPLNADGTYGAAAAANGAKITVTDAELALSTTSNWGDYQLTVSETSTAYLRTDRTDDGWAVGSNVLGAVVEAQKNGETIKVGMQHLQNIWVQPYQIAFNISGEDGNVSETAKLQGATITKITYFVPEGVYEYTFDGTYVKPKYTAELNLNAAFNNDHTAVTLTGVPSELKDVTVSVFYKDGRTNVYAAQDAALVNGSAALSAAVDSSKTYTVLLSSSNYADMSTTISAAMTEEQRATLAELIETGTGLVEADSSLTTLKAHIEEAKELLENPDATSAQADELIAELNELIAEANPGSKTATGEAQVQGFGYTAKVSGSYDT
ncbi:MAG: S-layer homology domain-containing protein, partial [Butyricicoccus sp.]